PEAIRRQLLAAGLPAKSDAAAELAVPHPLSIAGNPRHLLPVEHRQRRTGRVEIDETCQECVRIRRDLLELFVGGNPAADVVRRPAALERIDVARKVFARRPDEVHASPQVTPNSEDYFCCAATRVPWLATHCQRPSRRMNVSVKSRWRSL